MHADGALGTERAPLAAGSLSAGLARRAARISFRHLSDDVLPARLGADGAAAEALLPLVTSLCDQDGTTTGGPGADFDLAMRLIGEGFPRGLLLAALDELERIHLHDSDRARAIRIVRLSAAIRAAMMPDDARPAPGTTETSAGGRHDLGSAADPR